MDFKMMFKDKSLAVLEKPARKLCKLRGYDPDVRVEDATNMTAAYVTVPAWVNAALEIQIHLQIEEAIKDFQK